MSERGPVGGAGESTARKLIATAREFEAHSNESGDPIGGCGKCLELFERLLKDADELESALAAKAPQGVDSQIICRKLDAVAQHLNLKGRPQSLDIATAVRLVEEAAEWAARHIEERGRELDTLRGLTAALEAALTYLETLTIEHSPDCSYGATNGPHGDFCDCGLRARRTKRIQVYRQLQAALAMKAPQGVPAEPWCKPYASCDWCGRTTHDERKFSKRCDNEGGFMREACPGRYRINPLFEKSATSEAAAPKPAPAATDPDYVRYCPNCGEAYNVKECDLCHVPTIPMQGAVREREQSERDEPMAAEIESERIMAPMHKRKDYEKETGRAGPAPGAERLRERLTERYREIGMGNACQLADMALYEVALVREALAAAPPAPHPAEMALEHDRTQVAEQVTAMKNTLQNYAWLLDGRGSYEWDDDRYRLEFQTVCAAMQKHVEVLARIAADWSNCPKDWKDVQAARDRHASAERVRELELTLKKLTLHMGAQLNIIVERSNRQRSRARNRTRRYAGMVKGWLRIARAALPPSTGEKRDGD